MKKPESIPINILNKIDNIKSDHIHGSTFLTKKTIQIVKNYSNQYDFQIQSSAIIKNDYVKLLKKIIKAQPQMAMIFTFANQLIYYIDDCKKNQIKNKILTHCYSFEESLDKYSNNIGKHILSLIRNKKKILTYSSSSSVYQSLVFLKEQKKKFEVLCSESRPRNEGASLAKELGNKKIRTLLSTDAYLMSHVSEADLILIGADAICRQGVTNKVGSKAIITLALEQDIPRYVLCSDKKILPYTYQVPNEVSKPRDDITRRSFSPEVSLINLYFDVTSLNKFSKIISEKGVFSPQHVIRLMKNRGIHHLLLD
jgi:translation initiation factor 2B subunit (eIF-2B alpha/beta/delta family)